MPIIDTVVPEVMKQCIDPISESIARQILELIGATDIFKDNLFIITDDLKPSNFDDTDDNKRIQNNRCDITITPSYNPLETIFEATKGKDTEAHATSRRWMYGEYPIFSDPRAQISVFEVAVPCSVELAFSMKAKSVEVLDALNTRLYSRYLTGGAVYDYNDVQFAYGVPDRLLLLMYRMFKLQADVSSEMSFQDYLKIGSNSAITVLKNKHNIEGDQELVVQRTNVRVLGRMDYGGEKFDTEDFNKVSNRYVINFAYHFQFAKPALLRIDYPVMVNNQLIDPQPIGEPISSSYGSGKSNHPVIAFNKYFMAKNESNIDLGLAYPHIQYPYYDDWTRASRMYKDIMTQYQPLFTGLLSVTVDPVTGGLSLSTDIANEIFPLLTTEAASAIREVITYFEHNPDNPHTVGNLFRRLGIFDISVFCNDAMVVFSKLNLSKDLLLTVGGTIDITKVYRIVISQISNLHILNREYIYFMLEHPDYYEAFLSLNMNLLIELGYINILKHNFIPETVVTPNTNITNRSLGIDLSNRAITLNRYKVTINRIR